MSVGDVDWVEIPEEVSELVGEAMSRDNLEKWWESPNKLLENKSPVSLWKAGEEEKVLNFIKSGLSGDMT